MASAKEIINFTKNVRGKSGVWMKRFLPDLPKSVDGQCEDVGYVVDQFHGQRWRSNEAKYSPEQVFPGHTLGVIPTRGKAGIVLEYSRPHNFVLSSVQDMSDIEAIRQQLEELTGYPGWEMKKGAK